MGTRALIRPINEDGKVICDIYVVHDGYPDGWMLDIIKFLSSKKIVNGYTNYFNQINGIPDMVAQIITFIKVVITNERGGNLSLNSLKISTGSVYVYEPSNDDGDAEYVYYIYPDQEVVKLYDGLPPVPSPELDVSDHIRIKVIRRYIDPKEHKWVSEMLFDGTFREYIETFDHK